MFSQEKYQPQPPILPPDLHLTAPGGFQETHANYLWVSTSSNLPFTADYSYLQVNLYMFYGEKY